MTRPESSSGSDTSEGCRMDPFSQCAKVLKGRKLPCDADVPVWFEEVEKIFSMFGVPQNNRVHLIMPALSERVRYLFASLSAEEVADYERVKAAVLEELRLTPGEYIRRFETASKRKDEGGTQFASRVRGYFTYYLDARGADTKQDLVERIIADRVKNGLGKDSLKYVILREGEGWMKAHEIAKILQTFEEAEGKGRLAKVVEASVDNGAAPATKGGRAGRPFRCYECQKEGHLARDCPTRKSKPGAQPGAGSKVSRIQSIVVGEDEPAPDTSGLLVAKLATGPPQAACTSSLQRVEIVCAGVPTNAILDTGCEITVIREGLLPTSAGDPSGSIRLISAFGQAITAKLARLPLQLRHDGTVVDGAQINIMCALTDELAPGVDCLLTGEDWALLMGGAGPSSACSSLIPGSRLLRPAMYTAGDNCLEGCGSLIPGSRLLLPARYTAGDDCLKGSGSLIPGSRLLLPARYTAGDDCLKGCGSLIPGSRLLLPARYTAGDDCLGGSSSLIPGSRLLRPARYTAGDNSLDSEGTVVKGLKVRLSCGSESYNVVRELVAPLPSERTLQRRLQQHKFPPGILIEMMKPLEVKVGLMSPAERHAVLMMDEIQLNEGLDYDATTGTVIGRPTIGLSSGKLPDSCLATHGFVFMLGGMSTRWKQTVAYEFTENSFSAATVKTTIDTLIRRCEQIGIKVHALVTDMGGGNQALWRAYGILVGKHSKETCYANHPCDPARRLYFVADVPHLLKNLRNHLIRGQDIYLPDEVVKKNALPTDTVSIKQVEQLLELDEQSDMRVAPRLKKACISPGHYAKMKVGPAYTLFHHDTAAGLRYLVKLGRLDEEALTTAWFFEQVQRWFELMSSRTKVVAFSHKAQAGLDFLKDFITLFQDLAIGSRVRVWKPIRTGVILSTTSAMELQTMMVGDHHFEYLLFSRLSQDALENLFSTIRLKNPVPRPKEFKSALRTVTLAQFLRPSSHGSYTKADGELLVGLENSAPEDPDPPPLQPGLLDLDTAEQDSFEYLCGYAVQQVKKNLKTCNNCSAAICAERPMQDANDLVRLKSYTSNRIALVVPSKATLSLLEAAERYYRRNEKLVIDNSLSIHNLRSSILDATGPCEIPVCHDVPMKLLRCFLSTRLHMTLRKLNQQIRDKKQSAKCGSRSVGMRHAVVNI
ncbi:hypothetical protein ISCGN_008202 [Ixodes scapularis]